MLSFVPAEMNHTRDSAMGLMWLSYLIDGKIMYREQPESLLDVILRALLYHASIKSQEHLAEIERRQRPDDMLRSKTCKEVTPRVTPLFVSPPLLAVSQAASPHLSNKNHL